MIYNGRMSWIAFSLLSITFLAIAELVQQHLLHTNNRMEERTSAVLLFFTQALLILPIIFIFNLNTSMLSIFTNQITPYLLLVSLLSSISMILYLRSFKVENISISGMLLSFSIVVSTILGIIFLNESLSITKLIGIGLILTAIISLRLSNIKFEKNHKYALIGSIIFGINFTLDKFIVVNTHPMIYMFWIFLLIPIIGFLSSPKTVIDTIKKSQLSDFKALFISAIAYLVFNLCTFYAYSKGGEVGKVDAINNTQVFLIIVAEFFILKQRDNIWRKLITAFIAFIGIWILGNY